MEASYEESPYSFADYVIVVSGTIGNLLQIIISFFTVPQLWHLICNFNEVKATYRPQLDVVRILGAAVGVIYAEMFVNRDLLALVHMIRLVIPCCSILVFLTLDSSRRRLTTGCLLVVAVMLAASVGIGGKSIRTFYARTMFVGLTLVILNIVVGAVLPVLSAIQSLESIRLLPSIINICNAACWILFGVLIGDVVILPLMFGVPALVTIVLLVVRYSLYRKVVVRSDDQETIEDVEIEEEQNLLQEIEMQEEVASKPTSSFEASSSSSAKKRGKERGPIL